MVQILPQFDPGAEIGKSVGGGFGDAMQLLGQRGLGQRALGSAMEKLKPQPMLDTQGQPLLDESGQPKMKESSPLEALTELTGSLIGIPGGQQLIGEIFPVLREEMIRESKRQRPQPGTGVEGAQPSAARGEGQPESVEEQVDRLTKENIGAGMNFGEAQERAQQTISLQQSKKKQTEEAHKFASETFERNKLEDFGDDGLHSDLLAPMRNEFSQYIDQGLGADQAWAKVKPKYRAAQIEIGNLRTALGRENIGTGEEAVKRGRELIPKLIEIDPELARSLLQSEFDLGEAEASHAVRPGSKKYQKTTKNIKSNWDKYHTKDQFGVETPVVGADLGKARNQNEKALKRYLKNEFNPESDSLLALRGDLIDAGIDSAQFLEAVQSAFPEGAASKDLSDYNKNELPKLSKSADPSLGEIFRGILQGRFESGRRAVRKSVRGKK